VQQFGLDARDSGYRESRQRGSLDSMVDEARGKSPVERVEDALREIGTLLLAFAPLDAALSEGRMPIGFLLLFVGSGLLLFVAALLMERKRVHVR
jgi:hypothetical protein